MSRRLLLAAALALIFLAPAAAPSPPIPLRSSGPVTVTALAVSETSDGLVGQHSTISAVVLAGGTGQVYVSTRPLAQEDIQGSVRLAAQVAAATLGVDWRLQDYLVSFVSDSQVIGGPSAGGVMTLALTTALHNLLHPESPWSLDPTVAATGTINPDGTIGPVGGIPAKAQGAAQAGIKTFLYPAGQDQAATLKPGPFGLRQVTVDMKAECGELGITCRPAATLRDLIEAAAHQRLVLPTVATPATADYAGLLSPSVQPQVDALAARADRAAADLRLGDLQPRERTLVRAELEKARANLAAAQDALAGGLYYDAATQSFLGAIAAGRAENLTAFYASDRSEAVVTDGLAACETASQAAADEVGDLQVRDLNALYAIGAAQQRARDAQDLLAQARTAHDNAFTFDDWVHSLQLSGFCVERARTASWWADLRAVFPAGPALADPADLAQQAIDEATEIVTYADAVLGSQVTDAHRRLENARAEQQAGHLPAAVLDAVDAQTVASVAMQTGGGAPVPQEVLDAAREAASRAIQAARSQGVEPLLSVSLVELAQGNATQPATSLQEYWDARTLALLAPVPTAAPVAENVDMPGGVRDGVPTTGNGYDNATLLAAMAMGLVVGLGFAGVLVTVFVRRK